VALGVFAEHEAVEFLRNFIKEAGAIGREIENYHQGKDGQREFDAEKGKGNGDEGENDRGQGADGAAADFTLGNFRILDMGRK